MLEAAGFPVPRWTEVVPGIALDPAEWGSWVVVKADRGLRGLSVEAVAAGELRYRAAEDLPEGHLGRTHGPLLAQRYIRTGPTPEYYRVTTCFGVPIFAVHYTDRNPVPPGAGVTRPPLVLVRKPSDASEMTDDPAVIDLARRVHALIPDVPTLGCDILRDADDGSLWLAEINRTSVWALNSEVGIARQSRWGNDYYGQFGALDRAAEAMVAATRRFAR
jgi:glutathione synthase/RimK-type ligase-like ATP-grasp enzyme